MDKRLVKWVLSVCVLVAILLAVSTLSLLLGPSGVSPGAIVRAILEGKESAAHAILFDIRLPRILLGFAIGGSLSLAGVILQSMFRNPLVEPYTLGISGGAALGVSITTILRLAGPLGIYALPVSGFVGAFCVILFLRVMAANRSVLTIQALLLTGVMISFISSSAVLLIMSISGVEELHDILFWIIGSLGETDWFLVKPALLVSVSGLIFAYFFCFDLNALGLGEEDALHLGVNVERTKRILFILASVLAGLSVSLAGAIGFVGLVVPHFVRMFTGGDHRILLVSAFLSGATFLIFCDCVAKTIIQPVELPVGVVTGLLGGVLFIYTMTRKGSATGGKGA
ncbi:MAG TPA: iron ABC transporter permease [Syntrophorhabdales bacterium]|nr:iron ABC transporter permease [Syntrophorhabdales bacterium]